MRQRSTRLWAPGVTMAVALGASVLSAVALPTGPPHTLVPASTPGHVAFTDDGDRLDSFVVSRLALTAADRPAFATLPLTGHEGEASTGARVAFVSNAAGSSDVYVVPGGEQPPIRVTCGAPASHPVVAPQVREVPVPGNGAVSAIQVDVAWASTAPGAGNDGHWNIWTTTVTMWSGDFAPVPASGCAAGPQRAVVDAPRPLAGQRGDNLWPAWVGSQFLTGDPTAPAVTDLLVYESTRDNPLGDIYEQAAGGTAVQRRTDGSAGHVANTQPTVYNPDVGAPSYLIFTTTQFRPDGSLASLSLPTSDVATTTFAATSLWSKGPPQSSEPAVVHACSADESCGPWVAYTSTAVDSYGDVQLELATVDPPGPLRFAGVALTVPSSPGIAESHPAISVNGGQLSGLLVTRRTIAAGLSTATLADGSSRGPLVAADPDAGTPAYSPDGDRIAYSEAVSDGDGGVVGRRIVVANADGSGAVAQDFGQATDASRGVLDYDSQPAWSPDGTRVAFIREQYQTSLEFGTFLITPPQLYVATAGATTATALPLAGGASYYDAHPSWSPDGARIALSRTAAPSDVIPSLSVTAPAAGAAQTTISASASNVGFGPADDVVATISLPNNLTLVSAPGCTSSGTPVTVTCALGTVQRGAPPIPITLTVESAITCGSPAYSISESVATSSRESDPDNNSTSRQVTFSFFACVNVVGPRAAVPSAQTAAVPVPPRPAAQFTTGIRGVPGAPGPTGQPELWTVAAATGAGGPLLTADTGAAVLGANPSWSPDGLLIAYTALGQIDLATLAAVGAAPAVPETATSLTAVTGYDGDYVAGTGGTPMPSRAALSAATDPAWTPDGSEIVFAGQSAGRPDDSGIYAIKPDGTGLRTIAQLPQPETEPSVEPYRDATVTLTAAPASVLIGQQSTLTATVRNSGNTILGSGTLAMTLPAGLAVTAAGLPAGCSLAAATISCAVGTLAPGASTAFPVVATGLLAGAQPVTATYLVVRDRNPADNTATTTVVVARAVRTADVAVTIAPSQPVAYVGGPLTAKITVRNLGPSAAAVTLQTGFTGALQVTGTPACLTGGSPCSVGTLAPGGSAVFTVHLLPEPVGNPAHGYGTTLTAKVTSPLPDPVPANNTATVTLPVKQPAIRLLPAVQSPGFVTLAYGEDFPPGAGVLLAWDPGITTYPGPFTVEADGTLRAPMLIVGRDVLGQRTIVATSTGNQFSPVKNTMLVVPRTEAPPGFLERG